MRTFVVGDIHGQSEALLQVLKLSYFNTEVDRLIVLGDIVDGGPNTFEVLEILLTIKDLIMITGNHDQWFIRFLNGGIEYDADSFSEYQGWYQQGGKATRDSYKKHGYKDTIPITHQTIFNRMIPYYIDEKNRLFVHGGFDPRVPIEKQEPYTLMWDRNLIQMSRANVPTPYKNVFIGHTDIQIRDDKTHKVISSDPIQYPNGVIALDTGAGFDGRLTLMDVDSLKYWQSDIVKKSTR